ncbi:MAG: putative NTE family protein [Anaerolineales bacterium]|nr:putative NTE family protein [Anaerolineales bacterium]
MDITLALGGGGSKGNAHIGVLRKLEQEGFRVRAIAGTSFGGLVAAFYALGFAPDEIEALFETVDQARLYGHLPGDGASLLGLAGAAKWLDQHIGKRTFADTRLPCALTGVDLNAAREVILAEGSIKDAILATIAVPGLFPPRRIDQWNLVDGGALDPVPVSVARALAPRLPVVAVALTSPIGEPTRDMRISLPAYVPAPIARHLSNLSYAQAFDIFVYAAEIVNRQMTELRLAADQPEVVIRPAVQHINLLDKVDVSAVAKLGELAVEQALPELRRAVSLPARISRLMRG